nr:hypothetical protein [Mycoplasmopsis bovis]
MKTIDDLTKNIRFFKISKILLTNNSNSFNDINKTAEMIIKS